MLQLPCIILLPSGCCCCPAVDPIIAGAPRKLALMRERATALLVGKMRLGTNSAGVYEIGKASAAAPPRLAIFQRMRVINETAPQFEKSKRTISDLCCSGLCELMCRRCSQFKSRGGHS